jgi:hypothetical protein
LAMRNRPLSLAGAPTPARPRRPEPARVRAIRRPKPIEAGRPVGGFRRVQDAATEPSARSPATSAPRGRPPASRPAAAPPQWRRAGQNLITPPPERALLSRPPARRGQWPPEPTASCRVGHIQNSACGISRESSHRDDPASPSPPKPATPSGHPAARLGRLRGTAHRARRGLHLVRGERA